MKFTIFAPTIGYIGQYATAIDAQSAMRYLPYSVRQNATISEIGQIAA